MTESKHTKGPNPSDFRAFLTPVDDQEVARIGALSWAEVAAELATIRAECDRLRAACAWVAVSERMPDATRRVLVTMTDHYTWVGIAALDLHGVWRTQDGSRQVGGAVTHWMPMPAPAALSAHDAAREGRS